MERSCANNYGLNGNVLKIIAALSMLADHIGVVLLPDVAIFRVIGRVAFPIYAFMIAEGCAHTKNKLRYFLHVFLLGVVCQVVYYIHDGSTYMGILITFFISILVVYAMQWMKDILFTTKGNGIKKCLAIVAFLLVIVGVYFLNEIVLIDYGFWGCMAPVLASVFRKPAASTNNLWDKLDQSVLHVLMLGIGLFMLTFILDGVQIYAFLAIPILLLYSGKRGKIKMKYFFYVFYPAHLIMLQVISYFLIG